MVSGAARTLPVVRIARFASIHLLRVPPTEMGRSPHVAQNGVEVHTEHIHGVHRCLLEGARPEVAPATRPRFIWPSEDARVRVGVSTFLDWEAPEVVEGGVEVPRAALDRMETAIGEYADLLAITYQCRRLIRSPQPCVAIAPSDGEQMLFRQVTHLRATRDQIGSARIMPPILPGDLRSLLADRMDGVALLADSLGEDSPIGRIRDLFRFFERTFKKGPHDCIEPVTTFLRSHPRHDALRYGKAEVQHWFDDLRGASMHADRRSTYARSVDVAPFLGRMEFAAYDVLFNKEHWRHPSARRRAAFQLAVGVNPTGRSPVVMGPGAAVQVEWMDPWGGYPTESGVHVGIPEGWISRLSPPDVPD
jgi:hypothetical protein